MIDEKVKQQVLKRDGYKCQMCGIERKRGIRLQIDHITPVFQGGPDSIDNLQTLCSACNGANVKGKNGANFLIHITSLHPELGNMPNINYFEIMDEQDVRRAIKRTVNWFYRCGAVCNVDISFKKSRKILNKEKIMTIELFPHNPPEWLRKHEKQLLEFVQTFPRCKSITELEIT